MEKKDYKDYVVVFRVAATVRVRKEVVQAAFTKEFQDTAYTFASEADVVGHLAYNLVANDCRLTQLDGWADRKDDEAIILTGPEWDRDVLFESTAPDTCVRCGKALEDADDREAGKCSDCLVIDNESESE